MNTKLDKLVKDLKVGTFSGYLTTSGPGQDIPFALKPAQQFLSKLGAVDNPNAKLSKTSDGKALSDKSSPDVIVSSFEEELGYKTKAQLTITGARSDELLASAKIYINEDIISAAEFTRVVAPGTLENQTRVKSSSGEYLQNLAVGICHAQKVDLLAEPSINSERKAILGPRSGSIDAGEHAMLLLSSPALNVGYGLGNTLTPEKKVQYIEGMYRNLFNAATSEGYKYIALPAAGLGVFKGDPNTYFTALMKIAKEFPELNIIYNSGHPSNAGLFDTLLEENKPANLVRTDKDVLFIAHELTKQEKPCAFHNPSDADVVLGIYDVGEYWKTGKGNSYVGEEHIGAMTTAPINSRELNPKAYENVVKCSFLSKPIITPEYSDSGEIIPQEKPATNSMATAASQSKLQDTITQEQLVLAIAKVCSLDNLTSTRFLPFEKMDKKTKEDNMNRFMQELVQAHDPNKFQITLIKLFKEACTVRNWLSSEKYSTNTHSASVLRDKILRSPDILKILGIDSSLNKKAKDSALKKLMETAFQNKADIIEWEKDPDTSRKPNM